ncbi:MAG: hypothetical protein ACRDV6_09205 [Acidimicrobiales bacterium]
MQATPKYERVVERVGDLERTVDALEEAVRSLADEIRTRQIVVVDDDDHPRIVGEVFGDVAELRLELPTVGDEPGAEVLLFAVSSSHPGPVDLGPAVGIQLRARGRAVVELDAWPDPDGRWQPHLHLGGN